MLIDLLQNWYLSLISKHEHLKELKNTDFRRLTGVKQSTFSRMLEVFEKELVESKKPSGRHAHLSPADQLLMMLEYNRECRTYFHISKSWGLSESNAYRAIKRAENLLIKSGEFSLPGRKVLQAADSDLETVIVDAKTVQGVLHHVPKPKEAF